MIYSYTGIMHYVSLCPEHTPCNQAPLTCLVIRMVMSYGDSRVTQQAIQASLNSRVIHMVMPLGESEVIQ